ASLLAPLRSDLGTLCAMRVFISVGAAAAYPAALAVIRTRAGAAESAGVRDIARIQLGNSVGVVLGPVVGGLIVSLLSWEFLFWVSCPLAVAAAAVVLRLVPSDRRVPDRTRRSTLVALDLPGALLF